MVSQHLVDLGEVHDALERSRERAREEADHDRAKRSFWRELPMLLVGALLAAVLIKLFLFQAFYIPSPSMEDTLQINDRVMVSKLSNRIDDLERGDIVVFDELDGEPRPDEAPLRAVFRVLGESIGVTPPASELIKRVVALPGETIEVRDDVAIVDGVPLDEPYARIDGFHGPDYGPEVVPAGHLFVLGDHRRVSQDSRVFGPVPEELLVGRAFVILWPPSHWSGL